MRVGICVLGCDKNTVDAEQLAGLLIAQGLEVCAVAGPPPAGQPLDAVVVVSCGFTNQAREENIARIVEWAEFKKTEQSALRLYVGGCLSQRYAKDLSSTLPEIDGLVGVGSWPQLASMIARNKPQSLKPQPSRKRILVEHRSTYRAPLDAAPYAFLKISDGCDHQCSFCSIPLMKGRFSSCPRPQLLNDARQLIERGAREINVIAQDVSQYGRDRYSRLRLVQLLEDLLELPGDFRLRLLYCYPGGVSDDLLKLLAEHPKFCRYLDLPLQHLDPAMLRAMRRPRWQLSAQQLIGRVRERVPGIAIRTSLMVGFPGERPHAFRQLLNGVRQLRFDWMGAFVFSPEEGTPAASLPRQVGAAVKQRRFEQLLSEQSRIAAELAQARVGRQLRVLIEGCAEDDERLYLGRSEHEAPEVDGLIFVNSVQALRVGDFCQVKITGASTYDLFAECVPEK